jgi:hypothetical protein
MSYSCLNMDDLQDQINLQTVNLCLETENSDLITEEIPGVNILNNFLLSFDTFRGTYYEGNFAGYFIPFITANFLNIELYDNLLLNFAPEMITLYEFLLEYYNNTIGYIYVFENLNTETYLIVKELCYFIETTYEPAINSLINVQPVGPKGVFRKTVSNEVNSTTLYLDSVVGIDVGMYVRGPLELDYGGDNPINDPALLPVVTNINTGNTSVTISIQTNVNYDDLILFGFPEFCSANRPGTQKYPSDSYTYILNMKNELRRLGHFIEQNTTLETVGSNATVSDINNKFYLTDLDGNSEEAPVETFVNGITYRIDQSDPSNLGRPLAFSTTQDGTHNGGEAYTDNVTVVGTPGFSEIAYIEITITENTPDTFYYFSPNFPGMGNEIITIKNIDTPSLKSATLLENNNIIVEYNYAINTTDWVGIFKEGDVPGTTSAKLYLYVGGTQLPTDLGNGTLLFNQTSEGAGTIPLPAGNYAVYYFQNDLYKQYGNTLTLTIQ